MALDKLVDSTQLNNAMTATASAIRAKTGDSSSIPWDINNGFASAISAIPIHAPDVIITDTQDEHGGIVRSITTGEVLQMFQGKAGIVPSSVS